MFSQTFRKKIIDLSIVLGFFILPIILFLRSDNLAQTNITEFLYLVISQIILFFFFL